MPLPADTGPLEQPRCKSANSDHAMDELLIPGVAPTIEENVALPASFLEQFVVGTLGTMDTTAALDDDYTGIFDRGEGDEENSLADFWLEDEDPVFLEAPPVLPPSAPSRHVPEQSSGPAFRSAPLEAIPSSSSWGGYSAAPPHTHPWAERSAAAPQMHCAQASSEPAPPHSWASSEPPPPWGTRGPAAPRAGSWNPPAQQAQRSSWAPRSIVESVAAVGAPQWEPVATRPPPLPPPAPPPPAAAPRRVAPGAAPPPPPQYLLDLLRRAPPGAPCAACFRSKVKCDRAAPCSRCRRLGLECESRKPGRPSDMGS
jgi:hypothetical protein